MKKIDCKSLMIGDWLWYEGQFNAFPFKVEQITKRKVGYHAEPSDCNMYYIRLCECKPIKLTAEILEKNGFKHEECGRIVSDDGRLILLNDENFINSFNTLYMQIYNEDFEIIATCELTYVHQLQHALRLSGIGKEIIL